MANAVVQAQNSVGGSATWLNIETGGKYNREDTTNGTTNIIPLPASAGTNFSWIKSMVLFVTTGGTTSISNRRISNSAATATGITVYWKALAVSSYAQAAAGNMPTASGSNGAIPAGYTAVTTSTAQYDNTSVSTASTGPTGSMVVICLGVDNTYAAGANNAAAMPTLLLGYDEA